jgi:RNA polymerase sigma-70 factor, ECF subfamily
MCPDRPARTDITGLLTRWSEGDAQALDLLLPVVYDECRRIAARELRRERVDHTLAPTALVHELYLRLVDQRRATWESRSHFFGVTARLMRRVLVDHARARCAAKRGGSMIFVPLDDSDAVAQDAGVADIIEIDQALERLGTHYPDQVRIVELRYFAGLTVEETAHVLGRSPRTIKREWRMAKAWLHRELQPL